MKNKIYLVTGSLKGIGKAIALELLRQEATVIINSPHDQDLTQIHSDYGPNASFIKADISKVSDVLSLRNQVMEKFGHLDGLVANAGINPRPCGINDITEENIDNIINVNLKGTFWTLKILGTLVQETAANGSIVALTSVDGLIGEPYGVIYSTTKAGIISLTKSFARHYKNPLVRVNAIAPGLIDTPMTDNTGEDPHWTTDLSIIQRIGKPEEIAHMAVFLLSDKASYITGQIYAVDGGFTLK